jgi:carbon monoxide dehydrogenase subunit G
VANSFLLLFWGGFMNFTIEKRIKAEPEKVWKLISDFSFSPGHGVEVRVTDAGAKNSKNLIRDVTIGKMVIKERIENVEPGKSFSYSIIKGTPTKSYKGKDQIEKRGNETVITWSGDFIPKIPFIGLLIRMIAKKNVSKYLDAVLLNLK